MKRLPDVSLNNSSGPFLKLTNNHGLFSPDWPNFIQIYPCTPLRFYINVSLALCKVHQIP